VTALAAALALSALALFVWSYAIYPPLIGTLARRAGARPVSGSSAGRPRSVEVILSAADEEAVIGARVANLLAAAPGEIDRIAIGCDGCRDGTAERARQAAVKAAGAVRIVEFPERRGKAAVLNDLVGQSTADLIVFTDANTRFEPGAVGRLARAFEDQAVGAACGRLLLERGSGAAETPESVFWDRESRLKEAEGRLGVCVGGNGALYAVRRELVTRLPDDTTSMDDFLIPVRVARRGKRIVFVADATAREDAARDVRAESSRRFRIGIGAGQVLRRETWLLGVASHPLLTFAFLSRKASRWLAPLLLLAAGAAALFSPRLFPFGAAGLAVAAILLASASLRPPVRGPFGRLYYFGVLNVALALGVAAGLSGFRRPAWVPTARSL
jgi:cellulose synthase/poly-beta-1,6-N-acetylglucosamine synthase-like glycosyltransferase